METQYEARITLLEGQLQERGATIQALRLTCAEYEQKVADLERQIAECGRQLEALTRPKGEKK